MSGRGNKSSLCRGFIISCMDYRTQFLLVLLHIWFRIKYGSFDNVAVAGGAGNRKQLATQLELSEILHHPDVFILTAHQDCGAGATKADLMEAMQYCRQRIEAHDVVRGFWMYRTRFFGFWWLQEIFIE